MSMSWYFSLRWASIALCPVPIFISYGLIFLQHPPPYQVYGRKIQSPQHLQFPHNCCFLFFGSGAFVHLKPSSAGSKDEGKNLFCLIPTPVPLLCPLIYSLRNEDIILALEKYPEYEIVMIKEYLSVQLVIWQGDSVLWLYYLWQPFNRIFP